MKKYEFSFSANWVFDEPIREHHFLLRCMPGTYSFQRTYAHSMSVSPHAALTCSHDGYGNEIYTGSIEKPHSSFSFSVTGFVLCSKYIIHEPLDRLFLYPSRFTTPSDEMRIFLAGLELPESELLKAGRLCEIVYEMMEFAPGSTRVDTPSCEAFAQRKGVSRDYAQILITLCRLARMPARYVIGLKRGAHRSHVWTEVYCDGAWNAFDATTGERVLEGYLKIAHGLDYSDCSVDRYCYSSDSGTELQPAKSVAASVSDHLVLVRDTVPRA